LDNCWRRRRPKASCAPRSRRSPALSILATTFTEGRERNLALGIWGGIAGSGAAAGTLLGGVVLGVAQQIGAQINISDETLAGFIVFLAVLVIRPEGLTGHRARS